jgi:hypothetical protein
MTENSGPDKNDMNQEDQIPSRANPILPNRASFRTRAMREALLGVVKAAEGEMTALLTRQFGQVSLQNNLGTERAPYALPGFDDNLQFFYLLPSATPVPGSIPVTYNGGRASLNLYVPFSGVNRLAPDGRREIYPMKPTAGEIIIGDKKGWGLYCRLSEVTSEPLTTLSEEEKQRRKATRERNKQKRNGGDAAATGD